MGKVNVLGLKDMTSTQIQEILISAEKMKPYITEGSVDALQGKRVMTLFYENSTRTKKSFSLAGQYLGAHVEDLGISTSSVSKGETLIDTGVTLDRMGTDVIVIRHGQTGAPHLLARTCKASIINAGDGCNEHPTQGLLDLLTIKEQKGDFKNLKVAIVGDIAHSRVARSNIYGLTKLGAKVVVSGPSTLVSNNFRYLGADVTYDVGKAVEDADVVMGLRVQLERQSSNFFPSLKEYNTFFGLDEALLSKAKKDAIIMHPGPVNRGVEMTSAVIDHERSVINEQVTNGVAVRMALLAMVTGKGVH